MFRLWMWGVRGNRRLLMFNEGGLTISMGLIIYNLDWHSWRGVLGSRGGCCGLCASCICLSLVS